MPSEIRIPVVLEVIADKARDTFQKMQREVSGIRLRLTADQTQIADVHRMLTNLQKKASLTLKTSIKKEDAEAVLRGLRDQIDAVFKRKGKINKADVERIFGAEGGITDQLSAALKRSPFKKNVMGLAGRTEEMMSARVSPTINPMMMRMMESGFAKLPDFVKPLASIMGKQAGVGGGAAAGAAGVTSAAGGAALLGVGVVVTILKTIVGFVMNLKPVQQIMSALYSMFQLFFLPPAIMFMFIMLPFIQFMAQLFKSINLPQYVAMSKQFGSIMSSILQTLLPLFQAALPGLEELLTGGTVVVLLSAIILALAPLIVIAEVITLLKDEITRLMGIKNLGGLVGTMKREYGGAAHTITSFFSNIGNAFKGFGVPHYATGGYVSQTGLIYAHAGEYVNAPQSGINGGGVNITMNVNVNSSMDAATAANKIVTAIQRHVRRTGGWTA